MTNQNTKSEPKRRHLVNQLNKERKKRWEKIGICYFPKCTKNSIRNSHSLSEKMMIDPISENRHVFGPKVNTFTGKYEIGKIPVGEASIFPGFCQNHENLFAFEKEGEISNGKELQMQLFRSICRQLFFLEHERVSVLHYRKEMGKRLLTTVERELTLAPKLKTSNDELKGYIDAEFLGKFDLMVEQREKDISYVTENWYKPNSNRFGELLSGVFYEELIVCTKLLPVVLSGPILFDDSPRDDEGTPDFDYVYYVNIFPNKGKTHVHMVSLKKQEDKLKQLAESFEKSGQVLQTHIDKWMLRNCDLWYVSPTFWKDLDNNIKERVIEQLGNRFWDDI